MTLSRRTTDGFDDAEIAGLAREIGDNLVRLRRQRHLSQADLARRVSMPASALSVIENGRHVPSGRTLFILARALGVSPNDLFDPPDATDTAPIVWLDADPASAPPPHVVALARAALTLEDRCGVPKWPMIPLHMAFDLSEQGMIGLAAMVRHHLGITHAVIFDYLELLENAGLRILFCELPPDIESLAAYDPAHANAFIFIARALAERTERQLFRLIYEVGRILIHARRLDGGATLTPHRNNRLAKVFAGHFLMPEWAVRATVSRLGVPPDGWQYDILCRVKTRFGVSAEALLYTLGDLKLMTPEKLDDIKQRIYAYYKVTGFGEPGDRFRRLNPNAAFLDLLQIASLGCPASDPRGVAEIAAIATLIAEHGQRVAGQSRNEQVRQ